MHAIGLRCDLEPTPYETMTAEHYVPTEAPEHAGRGRQGEAEVGRVWRQPATNALVALFWCGTGSCDR